MNPLSAHDYDDLCRSAAVGAQIGAIDANRKAALKSFWLILVAGILAAAGAAFALLASGWPTLGWIAGALIFFAALALGLRPLSAAGQSLKLPVLEALAAKGGMEYSPSGFAPPLYPEARKTLFGTWLSSETFSDLFHGTDEEGRAYAVYEGHLQRSSGKSTHTIFLGQIYAVQRLRAGGAVTVIIPDRGLFNFFKPARGMERVKVDYDPEFEKKFEVYSTHEVEAKQLLFDSALRRRLLDLRQAGRIFAYIGPEGALVAATGKDRFEAGSMFRSTSGDLRVRRMFDDVRASMDVLSDLKSRLV